MTTPNAGYQPGNEPAAFNIDDVVQWTSGGVNRNGQVTATPNPTTRTPSGGEPIYKVAATVGTQNTVEIRATELEYVVPAISFVAPNTGTTIGGASVTITGVGFGNVTAVKFGTSTATFSVASTTSITATSPAHGAATVDVVVVAAGGTSSTSAADQFTYA